ncbi:MAG: zinc ABC transporter substrate-binding protein, partial [Armatimonadetes bacterium]|nr:zinc ABC transporter substrate-binding protein [Armatimonadota bacterium]
MLRVAILGLAGLLVVANSSAPAATAGAAGGGARLSVVASFYPLYEFAKRVGGERAEVRNLVPAGAEPHDYEPTPRDMVALTRAKIVVYNGAGLEPWIARVLRQLPRGTVVVNASAGLRLVKRNGIDPHVWLDPVLAQQQAANIAAGFARADPAGRGVYEANAARLRGDLQALHGRFA